MMFDSGENMLSLPGSAISFQTVIPSQAPNPAVEEMSIEQQILNLQDTIVFLEKIWLEDPAIQQEIDAKDWQEFMDSVYQSLLEFQIDSIQLE